MAAWRNGMMPTRQLLNDVSSAIAFKLTGGSDDGPRYARDRTLRAIEGVEVSVLKALSDQITPALLDEVRRESKGLIDLHHDAGRDTYIVSASPVEIIDDFAEAVGMTGALGTVAEIVDGRYTGDLAQPFCYGEGKADAIQKLAAQRGYDLRLSYGYTDSISDLPMLEIVGHPVAVNPDHGLASVAYQRGWPIIQFSRRSQTGREAHDGHNRRHRRWPEPPTPSDTGTARPRRPDGTYRRFCPTPSSGNGRESPLNARWGTMMEPMESQRWS